MDKRVADLQVDASKRERERESDLIPCCKTLKFTSVVCLAQFQDINLSA